MTARRVELSVLSGSLTIESLDLPFLRRRGVSKVAVGGRQVAFEDSHGRLELRRAAAIRPGRPLAVSIRSG